MLTAMYLWPMGHRPLVLFFFFSYYISCKYILDENVGQSIQHFQEAERSESQLFSVRTDAKKTHKVTEPSAAAHRIKPYLATSYQEPVVLDSYKEGEPKMRSAKRDDKTKGNSKAENSGKIRNRWMEKQGNYDFQVPKLH